ncbi:phage integrase [Lactobacillus selangorensis]|uniref:Phage integrase n=1 Tax=Lactobacillus selangorensis TaxID=81857 RepID=A0A0R2FRJ8_9LACO|nr:site-specific integrase [Lactobacillus selangorensis]KRN27722.1 phage integrase [Lactobacillus selangorensis]KRN30313.1 phage integrase [Lactobacillus selangorensis]
MATYEKYTKGKNKATAWKWHAYLGTNPKTGKKVQGHHRGFATKAAAKLDYERSQSNFDRYGTMTPVRLETFTDVYNVWSKAYEQTVRSPTFYKATAMFKNHILPFFGDLRIDQITMQDCQDFVNQVHRELVNFKQFIGLADRIFHYALHLQLIEVNPMSATIIPHRRKKNDKKIKKNFYEKDELKAFIDALDDAVEKQPSVDWDKARIFLRLLAFTGIRKGEAMGLQWQDVSFDDRTITINHAVKRDENGLYLGEPKSENSYRTIRIDSITMQELHDWRKEQLSRFAGIGVTTLKPDQLVFTAQGKNSFLTPSRPRKWMKDISDQYSIRFITVHGLRHTHATLLAESGANAEQIAAELGHYDGSFSQKHYIHTTDREKDATEDLWEKHINF